MLVQEPENEVPKHNQKAPGATQKQLNSETTVEDIAQWSFKALYHHIITMCTEVCMSFCIECLKSNHWIWNMLRSVNMRVSLF